MQKVLLPETVGYKANLHCHSVESDGTRTAKQLKEDYKSQGYSVLAYTDHCFMRDRTSLNDENFVAISGYENGLTIGHGISAKKYHLNFFAPSPSEYKMVGISQKHFNDWESRRNDKKPKTVSLLDGFDSSEYSVENVNAIIKKANNAGYLVMYNHPVWSLQNHGDYLGLKGLTGMEIFNYGCVVAGYAEENGYVYDLMLKDGQRLFCFANDDNHRQKDNFGGFNVLYPDKFDYTGVFESIKKGSFYASSGGVLRGISVMDGKVYIGAENAAQIRLTTNVRFTGIKTMAEKPLNGAVFELSDEIEYFRITVDSADKGKAFSRAYFKDEWQA